MKEISDDSDKDFVISDKENEVSEVKEEEELVATKNNNCKKMKDNNLSRKGTEEKRLH